MKSCNRRTLRAHEDVLNGNKTSISSSNLAQFPWLYHPLSLLPQWICERIKILRGGGGNIRNASRSNALKWDSTLHATNRRLPQWYSISLSQILPPNLVNMQMNDTWCVVHKLMLHSQRGSATSSTSHEGRASAGVVVIIRCHALTPPQRDWWKLIKCWWE